jgi:hypothetical protein
MIDLSIVTANKFGELLTRHLGYMYSPGVIGNQSSFLWMAFILSKFRIVRPPGIYSWCFSFTFY